MSGTVIVDYEMGNLGSIKNMLKAIGHGSTISARPEEIVAAERLILAGVGAFDAGMSNLERLGLIDVLREAVVERGAPVLGICLGMQLLSRSSQEGELAGLGWIDARTMRFAPPTRESGLKIPHMGWNQVTAQRGCALWGLPQEEMRFYFVHSYHVVCEDPGDVLGTTHHGHDFVSVVGRDNILGVQFHPEKSHKFGKMLLQNFVERA